MTEQIERADCTCPRCNERGVGTYAMTARCQNCGWEGTAAYSIGHEARPDTCPRCEVRRSLLADKWIDVKDPHD